MTKAAIRNDLSASEHRERRKGRARARKALENEISSRASIPITHKAYIVILRGGRKKDIRAGEGGGRKLFK